MSQHPGFNRFLRDATNGAEIWYGVTESDFANGNFTLIAPRSPHAPWVYIGTQEAVDELLLRFNAVPKSYEELEAYMHGGGG